jgi:hypothetical protein
VNKDQLSDRVNDLLGIDAIIDFSGMKKAELERLVDLLHERFSDPSTIIKWGVEMAREKVRGQILDRPLREFLEQGVEEEDEGLFGFGVLKAKTIINLKKPFDERRT